MWQNQDNQLYREFEFKDFQHAFAFIQAVAEEAERQQHHPKWQNEWNMVRVWLTTHDKGNKVTDKDHALAEAIDALYKEYSSKKPSRPAKTYKAIKLYADGGSRGNPGPSASGYVLIDEDDTVIMKSGVYLGITTNNQAEYQALKYGLEAAKKLGVQRVDVYLDSLLVVNQMKGIFKVKNRDLWPIHEAIKELANDFKNVNYNHVPRELNKLADAEVNETLDAEASRHKGV